MSLESLLSSLTPSEKLAAMNILWRDLSANSAEFRSPDWHGDVLAERFAHPLNKPRLTIDAAIDDVRARFHAERCHG